MTSIEKIIELLDEVDIPAHAGKYGPNENDYAAIIYTGKENSSYALGTPLKAIERETIQIKLRGYDYLELEKNAQLIKETLLKGTPNMKILQLGGLVDLGADNVGKLQIGLNFKLIIQKTY